MPTTRSASKRSDVPVKPDTMEGTGTGTVKPRTAKGRKKIPKADPVRVEPVTVTPPATTVKPQGAVKSNKKSESQFKTPVAKKRKSQASSAATQSFPERLNWNSRYYRVPVTSTPKPPAKVELTKKDVDTCFGFDESDEENYNSFISPIPVVPEYTQVYVKQDKGSAGFNALLARYGNKDEDDVELHFDTSKLMKTYSNKRKAADLQPQPSSRPSPKKSRGQKPGKVREHNGPMGRRNHVGADVEKWLEEKNKEFDDVLHVPLLVCKDRSN